MGKLQGFRLWSESELALVVSRWACLWIQKLRPERAGFIEGPQRNLCRGLVGACFFGIGLRDKDVTVFSEPNAVFLYFACCLPKLKSYKIIMMEWKKSWEKCFVGMGKKKNKKRERKEKSWFMEKEKKNSFLFLLAKIFCWILLIFIIVGFFCLLAFFLFNVGKEKKIISKPFYFIFFLLGFWFCKFFVSFENLVEMIKKKLGRNTWRRIRWNGKLGKRLGEKGLREKEISRRLHERTRTLNWRK